MLEDDPKPEAMRALECARSYFEDTARQGRGVSCSMLFEFWVGVVVVWYGMVLVKGSRGINEGMMRCVDWVGMWTICCNLQVYHPIAHALVLWPAKEGERESASVCVAGIV